MSDGRNEREKNYYLYFHGLSGNLLLHLSQHFYNDIRCRTYHDGSIKRVFRIDNRRENIIIQRENTALYVFACRFFFFIIIHYATRCSIYICTLYRFNRARSLVFYRTCSFFLVIWHYFSLKKNNIIPDIIFLISFSEKKFFFFSWKIFFRYKLE